MDKKQLTRTQKAFREISLNAFICLTTYLLLDNLPFVHLVTHRAPAMSPVMFIVVRPMSNRRSTAMIKPI